MAPDGPTANPGFHLWHAALRWRHEVGVALEPVELTHTQFFVLGSLHWLSHEGPPVQREVAELSGTDPMTTSQVVRALVKRGMITRKQDPDDLRAYRLLITAKGRKTFEKALPLVQGATREFFEPVGSSLPRLMAGLEKLSDH